MEARETFINATKNAQFGDTGWYEVEPQTAGELFRAMRREYGRCISMVYVDRVIPANSGPGPYPQTPERTEVIPVGWVFQKRMRYEDARTYEDSDYYLREVWVQVRGENSDPA